MTNSLLARLDATARRAFAAAGLADDATFTQAGSATSVPCKILVDRSVLPIGQESVVTTPQTVVTAYLSEIGETPKPGAIFATGTETFEVDAVTRSDESLVACIVVPV